MPTTQKIEIKAGASLPSVNIATDQVNIPLSPDNIHMNKSSWYQLYYVTDAGKTFLACTGPVAEPTPTSLLVYYINNNATLKITLGKPTDPVNFIGNGDIRNGNAVITGPTINTNINNPTTTITKMVNVYVDSQNFKVVQ